MAWDWKWGKSIKATVQKSTASDSSKKNFITFFETVIKTANGKNPGHGVKAKEQPVEWWMFGESGDIKNLTGIMNTAAFKLYFGRTADKLPNDKGGLFQKQFIDAAKTVKTAWRGKGRAEVEKKGSTTSIIWEELPKGKTTGYSCKISLKETSNDARDPAIDPTLSSKEPPTPPSGEWTAIQEEITLKMFQHILGPSKLSGVAKKVDGFGDQPDSKKLNSKPDKTGFAYKVIRPMWPYILDERAYNKTKDKTTNKWIPKSGSWLNHFSKQYDFIASSGNSLPNSNYKVYDYGGSGSFMDEIVSFITKGAPKGLHKGKWPNWQGGKISKKDSWNPADIWLVKSGAAMNKVMEELQGAITISKVNVILKTAYVNRTVVGISLKKIGKTVKYEEVNLEMKGGKSVNKKHPEVRYGAFELDIPFTKDNFMLKTNTLTVTNENGADIGIMRMGSNQTTPGNITFEFKAVGVAAAQLGKVPMDLMLQLWQSTKYGLSPSEIRQLPRYNDGVIDQAVLSSAAEKPNYKPKPSADDYDTWHYWDTRARKIKAKAFLFKNFKKAQFDNLIANIAKLKKGGRRGGTMTSNTAASLQLVEFAYMVCLLWDKTDWPKFDFLFESMYYFAQKKGAAFGSRFGPFGKLS